MIEVSLTILGAIIGGGFSLLTTCIIIKNERKSNYFQWLRNQKIETYKGLVNALSKINISITVNNSIESLVFDSVTFKENSRFLYQYTEEHLGELELFLPSETHKKIIELKSLLYKIISSNNSLEFEAQAFKNKNGLPYELICKKFEIMQIIQKDLQVFSK